MRSTPRPVPRPTPRFRPAAAIAVLAAAAAAAGVARADPFSAADRAFIAEAAGDGLFEIRAGQLAADRASLPDIRDEGVAEAHDLELAGARLRAIASGNGIALSRTLPPGLAAELDSLDALSGPAFDAAYLGDLRRIHQHDAAVLAAEAKGGSDPRLRDLAGETGRVDRRLLGGLRAVGPGPD